MSFEGYWQNICPKGHYFETEIDYGGFGGEDLCPICNVAPAETHLVDLTNGCDRKEDLHGEPCSCGRRYPEQITPATIETCDHCHHSRETSPALFRFGDKRCMGYPY